MAVRKREQYQGYCKEPGCDWVGPVRSTRDEAWDDNMWHGVEEHEDEEEIEMRVGKADD